MRTVSTVSLILIALVVMTAACQKKTLVTSNTSNVNAETNATTTGSFSTNANTNANRPTISVTITNQGIAQPTLTVASGTMVIFKNTDTAAHQIASNPHPQHSDYPGFNGLIASNSEYHFIFTRMGTWGYHDHLHPLDARFQGTVAVQ